MFGTAISGIAGFAGGTAIGPVLTPIVQLLKNDVNAAYPYVPPEAGVLAAGVAQGQVDPTQAAAWAAMHGISGKAFQALVNIANTGPPLPAALTLLRRGFWLPGDYTTALNRSAIEQQWYKGLLSLQDEWLTPDELAVMVQRGVVPDPGYLPVGPPTQVGKVPPMPVAKIDTAKEAAGGGSDFERTAARARIIGLPASPDLAARMTFRKIIDRVDFDRAISEGNTRNEWAPFLFDGFRQIPTAEQFVEAHLRGWITQPEMYAGTALHGMSQPDTDLEFRIHRRPLTPRQITQALAWGGNFNPEPGEIQDPYVASVHQANLGPEWYGLGEALKHTYSVPFWWRSMAQAGSLGPQEAETILLRLGNPPAFAATTTQHFAGGTAAATDPHIAKAENQLWTTTHASYKAGEINDATATSALTAAGVAAASIPAILSLWAHEFSLTRKELTATQVRKALNLGLVNPATGQPWTQAEALARLHALGYDQADATVFLQE